MMEIKKVKIESVSKDTLRSAFVFEKSWDVVDAIENILEKLGFLEVYSHGLRNLMSCGEPGPEVTIKEWVDEIYNMKNKNYSANIFFGKNKIILLINSCIDRQKMISEAVFEFSDFGDVVPKSLSKLGSMDLNGKNKSSCF